MSLLVKQTNSFAKAMKKLSKQQKKELDIAVKAIMQDPDIGERKKGDLSFLRVYKFKMNKKLTLLGYCYEEDRLILTLLKLGSHENFYRDMKR
ncbi:MAG: type II toxin-antitoxin system RelE/ParE family toxin [Francisellaceae bacterium]